MALYPQDPEFKSVSAYLEFKTDISTADTGHEQAVSHGGAPALISTTYNSIPYIEAIKLRGFLAAHKGRAKSFDLMLPVESYTVGDVTGSTPRATALTPIGSNTLAIKDLSPNKTVRFAGEWLKVAGHSKAYMLTEDLVSDGTGNATANFEPSLYEQVLLNEQITIDEIVFHVRSKTDMSKFNLKPGGNYSFKIDFVEVIR
ncbi:MAG: hypothetical protein V7785_22030 [Bermanella sp.]